MSEETASASTPAEDGGALVEVGTGLRESVEALTLALRAAESKAAVDIAAAEEKAAADVERERQNRKRGARYFFVALAADLVLSAVSIGLYVGVQDSLHQSYVTTQQQQATRVRVLCPLYSLLLASVSDPTPRAPGTPAQQAQFEKAVATIKTGYATLGCTPALPLATKPG